MHIMGVSRLITCNMIYIYICMRSSAIIHTGGLPSDNVVRSILNGGLPPDSNQLYKDEFIFVFNLCGQIERYSAAAVCARRGG